MGADTADGGRDGQAFFQDSHRFPVVPPGDGLDVTLGVDAARAVEDAGAPAVAVVVTHEQLDAGLPGAGDPLGLGIDHLSVLGHGGAGPQELGAALGLDNAEAASAIVLEFFVVAEVGDLDAIALGDLQEGLAGIASAGFPIDDNLDLRFRLHS